MTVLLTHSAELAAWQARTHTCPSALISDFSIKTSKSTRKGLCSRCCQRSLEQPLHCCWNAPWPLLVRAHTLCSGEAGTEMSSTAKQKGVLQQLHPCGSRVQISLGFLFAGLWKQQARSQVRMLPGFVKVPLEPPRFIPFDNLPELSGTLINSPG